MSTSVSFNRDYINYLSTMVSEIEAERLSVFAGAGVSIDSGFVDWKGLLKPIIGQLGVSSDIDLALVAQLYKNEFGRQHIISSTKDIVDFLENIDLK